MVYIHHFGLVVVYNTGQVSLKKYPIEKLRSAVSRNVFSCEIEIPDLRIIDNDKINETRAWINAGTEAQNSAKIDDTRFLSGRFLIF